MPYSNAKAMSVTNALINGTVDAATLETWLASNGAVFDTVLSRSTLVSKLIAATNAHTPLANSSTAMTKLLASSTARAAVYANSALMNKVAAVPANLDKILSVDIYIDDLAVSATGMAALFTYAAPTASTITDTTGFSHTGGGSVSGLNFTRVGGSVHDKARWEKQMNASGLSMCGMYKGTFAVTANGSFVGAHPFRVCNNTISAYGTNYNDDTYKGFDIVTAASNTFVLRVYNAAGSITTNGVSVANGQANPQMLLLWGRNKLGVYGNGTLVSANLDPTIVMDKLYFGFANYDGTLTLTTNYLYFVQR